MGLFNFVKEAGDKLWDAVSGHNDSDAQSKKIEQHLAQSGIPDAGKVKVDVKDGQATLTGEGLSQEAKEKILVAVGNIAGIAGVEDAVKADSAAKESRIYMVKSGDTLSSISKQMYGDANRYNKIFEANQPMLKSPDKIYPGQALRIPD